MTPAPPAPRAAPEAFHADGLADARAFALVTASPGLRVAAAAYGVPGMVWRAPSGPMASDEPRRVVRVVRVAPHAGSPLHRVVVPPLPPGVWAERADEVRAAMERMVLVEVRVEADAWAALGVRPGVRRVRAEVFEGRNASGDTRAEKEPRVDSAGQAAYRPGRAVVAPGGTHVGIDGAAVSPPSAPTIW